MSIAYAAFMDFKTRFEIQALYWIRSLIDNAQVSPSDVFIFAPNKGANAYLDKLSSTFGVNCIQIEYPFKDQPFTNKIGLWEPEIFAAYDYVCFNDCDIFYLDPFDFSPEKDLYARVVDLPKPSVERLKIIYSAAGLRLPDICPVGWPWRPNTVTIKNNFNGGLYLVRRELVGPLGGLWKKWVMWGLDHVEAFGGKLKHLDQIAMSLAITELSPAVVDLDLRYNCPTHLEPSRLVPQDIKPSVLHYHVHVDANAHLMKSGHRGIDSQIARANRKIAQWQGEGFENRFFWNFRYQNMPKRGSGLGSRGESLVVKRDALSALAPHVDSVLDVGCGDIEVTKDVPLKGYVGIDISEEALKLARAKRRDWTFRSVEEEQDRDETFDLVLLLDVLIHQSSMADYRQLIEFAVSRANDLCLISGYDMAPSVKSSIVFFHEPLGETLRSQPDLAAVGHVFDYRSTTVYACIKKNSTRFLQAGQPADIAALIDAYRTSKSARPLARLQDLAVWATEPARKHAGRLYTQLRRRLRPR